MFLFKSFKPLGLSFLACYSSVSHDASVSPTLIPSLVNKLTNLNATSNAFIQLATAEDLRRQTTHQQHTNSSGELRGQLIAVKDNFCTADFPTTCGSQMLHGYRGNLTDATVVSLLRKAGAIVVGKTNLDEFGMGSSTQHSFFGPTHHPFFPQLVPGGSSGGSACAVALNMAFAALGSDTGGSVRQPASYCGIVGLKPTYGLLSRWGLVAYASSLDTPGILAATVERVALLLAVLAQHDPRDATSYALPAAAAEQWRQYGVLGKWSSSSTGREGGAARGAKGEGVKGMRVGIPAEYRVAELAADVIEHWERTKRALVEGGATVVEDVSLPHTKYALPAYYVLASAEAASNLARFDGVRYGHSAAPPSQSESFEAYITENRTAGFGEEVKRRILLGNYVLSSAAYHSHYLQAQKVRRLVADDFNVVFKSQALDALLVPTAPTPAFPSVSLSHASNPVEEYINDIMTIPASLAGLPAISVNVATRPQLPFGMQLIGDRFQEHKLLKLSDYLHIPYQASIQVERL